MKIDWNRNVRIIVSATRPPLEANEISLTLEVDFHRPFTWTGTVSECFRNLGLFLEDCDAESRAADIPIIRQ